MSNLPLDEILTRALALDRAARSEFLDAACGEDAAARSELESLLALADRFPTSNAPSEAVDPESSAPLPEHIGRYPVVGVVGVGGMGRVYRARDPELEREVALKRLPARLQADPAGLARFRREARVLARLRHPNIATVYTLESEPEGPFLTMELVPGRTLHELLAAERLPVARALWIGVQIAAAMEAAHTEGIIHRDFKPLNIQVDEADEVKVLDFGLAKAMDEPAANPGHAPDGPGSAVEAEGSVGGTGPVTELGRVMGTPGYISPEQLLGRPVGPPADVWAFGCVLFECLTGTSPYSAANSVVSVPNRFRRTLAPLDLEPDGSLLPEGLCADVGELLRSCLRTEPGERPDSTAVRRTLERALEEIASPGSAERSPSLAAWLSSRRGIIALACVLAAIVGAVMLGRQREPAPEGIPTSTVRQLTFRGNTAAGDLSPDGETVAYLEETGRLVYLDARTGQERIMSLTSGAANDTIAVVGARIDGLRWSPSGQELAVVGVSRAAQSTTSTYVVEQGGHRAVVLGVADFTGVAWSPDGTRVAGTRGIGNEARLCIVDRESGRCRDVPLDRYVSPVRVLDWSAGDQLYFKTVESDSAYVVPVGGGTPRAVLKCRWLRCLPSRDGICYTVGRELRYAALDPSGLPAGDYTVLADRVPEFASPFSLARDGRRVLYDNPGMYEVWLGERATANFGDDFQWARPVRESISASAARFSPDCTRIALVGKPVGGKTSLLLVHSLADGSRTIVARDEAISWVDWSPDGTELVYRNSRGMARVRIAEGTPRQIPGPCDPIYVRWLPDDRIVYMERDSGLWRSYSQLDLASGSISRLPIDADRGTLFQFAMAPDGNSVAVAGNRGGHYDVKVWLIDLVDGSERLLYDGWAAPFEWSADGRWVYVIAEEQAVSRNGRRSRILRVAVESGAVEIVSVLPEPAFGWNHIDLSRDELRIVLNQRRIGRDLWLMDIEPIHD